MNQARQMPHHALELHVEDLGSGFHVTVHVDVGGAIAPARDRYRGISAFGDIEDLRLAFIDTHAAPVGDQFRKLGIGGSQMVKNDCIE